MTFGEDDVYQQSDAAGFIRLFALPARVRALKDQELARAAVVDGAGTLRTFFDIAIPPSTDPRAVLVQK